MSNNTHKSASDTDMLILVPLVSIVSVLAVVASTMGA